MNATFGPAGIAGGGDGTQSNAALEAGRARGRAAEPHVAARAGLSVLLVEDSAVLAERLRETLEQTPEVADLCIVDREAAAIEALGDWDVLIVDLHLRQGTGFGVLRALRRRPELQPVVVVFTNHDVPGYRRRAETFGAHHFLDKARDWDRLGEVLKAAHAARRAAAR